MQIILLSGGSGKRLWPLSNESRSKQFLTLLEKPDGTMESMVQRVVRQIREARLDATVTLATNAAQRDIIVEQLGEGIDMVLEPERRDTFPAIALACGYLKLAKHLPDNETVVIMPCDPYTEAAYFNTIARMADCVRQDVADLVLMGIKPTCPSSKFGYVVPEAKANGNYYKVQRFTEKPDVSTAEQLLVRGAFWNGGVFAFRLGYIMNIVAKYLPLAGSCADASHSRNAQDLSQSAVIRDFETLRGRYGEFPRISFDYEVVEKAKSVAVVPFDGEWKDLGTWNALTGEIKRYTIGNAHLGPKALNTHVINELSIPVYADGLQDVVVVASPEGILVCAKEETENIKKYVDNLKTCI